GRGGSDRQRGPGTHLLDAARRAGRLVGGVRSERREWGQTAGSQGNRNLDESGRRGAQCLAQGGGCGRRRGLLADVRRPVRYLQSVSTGNRGLARQKRLGGIDGP